MGALVRAAADKRSARLRRAASGVTTNGKSGRLSRSRRISASASVAPARRIGKIPARKASRPPEAEAPPLPPPLELSAPRDPLEAIVSNEPWLAYGGAGDHLAAHQMLVALCGGPSREAFMASLEDPFYEPHDRVVVHRGTRIVAHAQVSDRVIHFGSLQLPVSIISGLGTLPEFRGQGFGRAVLREAERTMRERGVVMGLARSGAPRFFLANGWSVCGRHSYGRAAVRQLLSELSARGTAGNDPTVNIRPWRQVELSALMRTYARATAGAVGAISRTEPYWRWLVTRGGFQRIFVAVIGPDKFNLDQLDVPIAGYVVTKDDRILELVADPNHTLPDGRNPIAEQLLARALGEAIERDCHWIHLHAPADHPALGVFRDVEGEVGSHEIAHGEVSLVKLTDPIGFVRTIAPELQARLQRAGLGARTELGLVLDGRKLRLAVSRRGVKLAAGSPGRSYLRLNIGSWTRLCLGHQSVADAVAAGRIFASTRLAQDIADALFPPLPLWRSPWDELYLY